MIGGVQTRIVHPINRDGPVNTKKKYKEKIAGALYAIVAPAILGGEAIRSVCT
jgi:hypothetical protein